jgi:beta-galactosidase
MIAKTLAMIASLVATAVGPILSAADKPRGVISENVDLSGVWRFSLDPKDEGLSSQWFSKTLASSEKIPLPGTTDEAGFGEKTTAAETGVLTRVVKYYGPAWYQRTIEIPAAWADKEIAFFLERVIWESHAWVDGRPCDTQESLNTPHLHQLGRLAPGKHLLTLRIDNRPLCPIGAVGHSYTEQTQTVWNGVVGRIELRARPAVRIVQTRIFPKAAAKSVEVEITLDGSVATPLPVTISVRASQRSTGEIVATAETTLDVKPGRQTVRVAAKLDREPERWDEFSPALYSLETIVTANGESDRRQQTFGFRDVTRVGQHIAINGRPIFLRGNLDDVNFPLTGYPAMETEAWKRLFKIYQAYGLNHVRFHTWTPPEAAFDAADEMGIYIQSEVISSQLPVGKNQPGRMERVGGLDSFPDALIHPPGTVEPYVRDEMRRIMDANGNHPSFVLFTIGNELSSFDPTVCGQWIEEIKTYDPRRFYAVSTARHIVPQDDYSVTHLIPGIGMCRDRVEAGNDWDYEALYAKAPVPIIAHEIGQWPTYPVWDEIAKYTGVLLARNLEHLRESARVGGVVEQDKEFRAASGALALRLYKDQIESHLRTPSCSGFELLGMQDYSGQGEALVGWLDSFYESKGTVTPERFRSWCGVTVPLARLPKYVYVAGETLTVRVDVAHYGPKPLDGAKASWSLSDASGKTLERGEFAPATLPISSVTTLGVMTAKLDRCAAPCRARLEVRLNGTQAANDWDVWVFPGESKPAAGSVEICTSLDDALAKLRGGKKVLLDSHQLGTKENAKFAQFKPVFWSAAMFKGQFTLGALVRAEHPALAAFPTEKHFDWQWEELCLGARAFRLDGLPDDCRPIVQPICDFHFNWRLGSIFELRLRDGGTLMVCGYYITNNLAARPAARQLRESLLAYINSSRFLPHTEIDETLLSKLFSPSR